MHESKMIPQTAGILPAENIYGHTKRLEWILKNIKKTDVILEFGCGTGYMITLPLAKMGYKIIGVDMDSKSVSFGGEFFKKKGLDPEILKTVDISELDMSTDVVIASEVFEHMNDETLNFVLTAIHKKLKSSGRALITVPNGYGWFEIESFLWFKMGLGHLLEFLRLDQIIIKIKEIFFGYHYEDFVPSTLAESTHIQRFTCKKIQQILRNNGFKAIDVKGSVFFAGPFSNLLFTGIRPLMRSNCALGGFFRECASGFYIVCTKEQR